MSTESNSSPPNAAGAPPDSAAEPRPEAGDGKTPSGAAPSTKSTGAPSDRGEAAGAGPTDVSPSTAGQPDGSGPGLGKREAPAALTKGEAPPKPETAAGPEGGRGTGEAPAADRAAAGGGASGGGDGGWSRRGGNNDLFGAEDLGLDPPPPAEGGRRATPVRAVMVGIGLVVLALLWYWSSVHHEKFYLSIDGDRVTVRRGLYFPFGTSTFAPTAGYSSFTLPSGLAPETNGPMSHEELDRVLRTLYVRIARLQLKDLDQGSPDKAEDMLRRALKLSFSSAADEVEVIELRGDVAFRRGLKEVRGIQERFDEALLQFRNAARQGGSEYTGADKWVESISRLRDEFRQLALASNLDPDKILSSPVPVAPAGFLGAHAPATPPPAKAPEAPRAPATQPAAP